MALPVICVQHAQRTVVILFLHERIRYVKNPILGFSGFLLVKTNLRFAQRLEGKRFRREYQRVGVFSANLSSHQIGRFGIFSFFYEFLRSLKKEVIPLKPFWHQCDFKFVHTVNLIELSDGFRVLHKGFSALRKHHSGKERFRDRR
ncbi:MAG: hypothetical protein BWX67_02349 [Thermotogae bacterium ADurb.Bin062]|nr:MAG: hypothetical protein BWX67_02349 [Thermotogota bacterium ADurb.Bin062]